MYYTGSNAFASLRQGLVGAWCPSLPNGGSGNTLPDQSGYNNHGSLVNMSPDDWVSGQYGRALDFDGSNDEVRFTPALSTGPQFLSFWINLRSLTIANRPTIFLLGESTGNFETQISAGFNVIGQGSSEGTGRFCVNAYSGTNGSWARAVTVQSFASRLNEWIHLACGYTGSTWRIFVNGIEDTNLESNLAPRAVVNNPVQVLGSSSGSRFFDGRIDDFRFYFKNLSEPEIRLLASRPGIGLRQESHRQTFYQFPSGARRKRILTGMP